MTSVNCSSLVHKNINICEISITSFNWDMSVISCLIMSIYVTILLTLKIQISQHISVHVIHIIIPHEWVGGGGAHTVRFWVPTAKQALGAVAVNAVKTSKKRGLSLTHELPEGCCKRGPTLGEGGCSC